MISAGHGASLWDTGRQGPRSWPAAPSPPGRGLTRGTGKPLRLTPGVQPKGSEKPSSYPAGSQRAKAWLEAPSVGLRLQGREHGADTLGRVPSLQPPPAHRGSAPSGRTCCCTSR